MHENVKSIKFGFDEQQDLQVDVVDTSFNVKYCQRYYRRDPFEIGLSSEIRFHLCL